MANPSTIWAQLALPNPPVGSIPYVLSDGATIGTDVLNFNYDSNFLTLFVANGLSLDLVDTTAGTANPITINRRAGRFKVAAGATNNVVNCSLASVGDLVFSTIETTDATMNRCVGRVTSAGVVVFTFNAATTGAVTISFILVKTSPVAA